MKLFHVLNRPKIMLHNKIERNFLLRIFWILLKRGNRNNTGNRWRNTTFLVAKLDIFMSNLSANRDKIFHKWRDFCYHALEPVWELKQLLGLDLWDTVCNKHDYEPANIRRFPGIYCQKRFTRTAYLYKYTSVPDKKPPRKNTVDSDLLGYICMSFDRQ